jgi:hypothetical protein
MMNRGQQANVPQEELTNRRVRAHGPKQRHRVRAEDGGSPQGALNINHFALVFASPALRKTRAVVRSRGVKGENRVLRETRETKGERGLTFGKAETLSFWNSHSVVPLASASSRR